MKVILLSDVKGTGKAGQIIEVSDGFARNFLLPKKLAEPADAKNINAATIKPVRSSIAARCRNRMPAHLPIT